MLLIYAWFSAASNVYATQTINTTSDADITVLTNNVILTSEAKTVAAFEGTDLLPNTYVVNSTPTAGLRAGLWAPYLATSTPIAIKPGSNNPTSVAINALVDFVQGTEKTVSATTTFTVTKAPTTMSSDTIRVVNNKSTAQTIYMNIFISAEDNVNSYKAARGVSAYIADTTGCIANTKYGYLDATVNDSVAETDEITINNTNFPTVNATVITQNALINHVMDPVSMNTNFLTVDGVGALTTAQKTQYGLGYNNYYVISVSLGSFAATSAKNFSVYTWLDGTVLDDAAMNANISISYAFSATQYGTVALS